jgi:ABC-type phosphate/phosphonate transport system substrate-binding protein
MVVGTSLLLNPFLPSLTLIESLVMIVGLPMYDFPELVAATEAWWQGLRRHFSRAGIADMIEPLRQPVDLAAHWLAPDLLFTQTCGYPLTHILSGKVQLVATPCYEAAGCEGPSYRSVVIVREDSRIAELADLRGKRVTYNGSDSQSGYNTLRDLVFPLAEQGRLFGEAIESGAHRQSLAYVRTGKADVAAIDCVSLALLERIAPAELQGIRKLCLTAPAPSLPYITSLATSAETMRRLRDGLRAAIDDPQLKAVRDGLLLADIAVLPLTAYESILAMENTAIKAGYPALG